MATNTFGSLLRSVREAADKTLKDLASHMGWSVSYVSDIERGRRNPPATNEVIKIARYLGYSVDRMLDKANKDRNRVEIPLTNRRPTSDHAALVLARRWTDLTDEQLDKIMGIVKENDD